MGLAILAEEEKEHLSESGKEILQMISEGRGYEYTELALG